MIDAFGRTIDYLRLSITDACNQRCSYCQPQPIAPSPPRPNPLTTGEIVRIVRVATDLGFRKFRLTGGEPLARTDLPEIIRQIAALPGVAGIGLTTNGTRLASSAKALQAAGLQTLNISLDTLQPQLYHRLTGSHLAPVLRGIHAALAAGFACVKLNCVLQRGINERDLWPLVLFAAKQGLPLRLIELMPLTNADDATPGRFFSVADATRLIAQHDDLVPLPSAALGWGPAQYYSLRRTGGIIGFVGAVSHPQFCGNCNRLRLTAEGKLRPCLGHHREVDLRPALHHPNSDHAIRQALSEALQQKPRHHDFRDGYQPCRPMVMIGG